MMQIFSSTLSILYWVIAGLYAIHFFSDERKVERFLTPGLVIALLLHGLYLTLHTISYAHFPTASPAEVLTVIALAMGLIYLWIESILGVKTTGLFVLAVIAAFQTASAFTITPITEINPILRSPLFSLHTSAAILGYSSIAISSLYALLYLALFYEIKGSRFGLFFNRLPSLEVLDTMNTKAAYAGFGFLTVTILLGTVWVKIAYDQLIMLDWKIVTAFLTWVIFGTVVLSKRLLGWSGKRIAYLSLTGFATVLLSLSVVNYFLTSFHRFY